MLRYINVLEILRPKTIDSNDFLAGITFVISSLQCVKAINTEDKYVDCGNQLPTLIEKYN